MSEIERLRTLATAAAREDRPKVDVTLAVMRRLREEPPIVDRLILAFTALSSAAAAVAAVMAVQAWHDWQDPLASLFESVNMVMR